MTERKFISFRNSVISYLRFGKGKTRVICFHGYGEDAGSFDFLDKYAGDPYSFYAVDLPFHGLTEWKEGLDFGPADLAEIVNNILVQESAQFQGTDSTHPVGSRLTLLGFSLGGRVALSYFQVQPQEVEKMILLAPDGLKVNFWYWMATQFGPGNKFFAFTMRRPAWFFGFLKLLNRIGLVNVSIFKFVNYYIGDREVRNLLYQRWTGLRKLKPRLRAIKSLIRKLDIPVRLLYGKHDRIIRASVGERFRKGIKKQVTLRVINSGHQVLHEKHVPEIIGALER